MLIIFFNIRLAFAVFFCSNLLFPRGTGRSPVSAKKLVNGYITAFSWAIKLTVFALSVHALSALRGAHFPSLTREKIRMGGLRPPILFSVHGSFLGFISASICSLRFAVPLVLNSLYPALSSTFSTNSSRFFPLSVSCVLSSNSINKTG